MGQQTTPRKACIYTILRDEQTAVALLEKVTKPRGVPFSISYLTNLEAAALALSFDKVYKH